MFLLILLLLQNPADLYKAATADMDAGRWAEAATKFEQVLKDDATHIPSQFNLAVCYSKLLRTDEAIPLYRKVIEQDAGIYEARMNLGILLSEKGDQSGAEEQFAKASALRPQEVAPVLYHAGLLEKRGDLAGAAESYDRATQIDPNDINSHFAAGNLFLKMKQNAKAVAHYEKGFTLDPKSATPQLRRRLGTFYREAGELDKAIAVLSPLGSTDNLELALVYFDKKDFAKAAAIFQVLVASEPANADYWYMLGKCQMESKEYSKAVASLLQTLKLKPDYVDAYSTLGSTYYALEDWTRAAATLERFIVFRPRQAYAYFLTGTCYDKLGNLQKAVLNYNKFLEFDDGSNDARSFQVRERAKTLQRRLGK